MKTKDITLCGFGAAIIVVLSQITVPMPEQVPFTLQTFAILIVSVILGRRKGFFACLVYVLLGAFGLPVFAGFSGGFQKLVGPTGGFIISFPIMAYISGFFSDKSKSYLINLIGAIISSAINLFFGCLFYMLVTESGFYESFLICVLPFILSSVIKALIAVYTGLKIKDKFSI